MRNIVIALVAVAALGGIIYAATRAGEPEATMTNIDALAGTSTVAILGDEVAYFPGATGYFAAPEAEGEYPGVVMIHENRGLRPEIRRAADELAKEGYMVLAVDLFSGRVVESQDEARAITASLDQDANVENMRAAADFLRERGATRLASLGWCFGGRQSIELAVSGEPLDATVVYYGGGMATTTARLAPIDWPVLGIFGDQDQAIPVATVRAFESSLNELGVPNEIHIYPGVGHAFANPSGMNYAPEATADAWAKTVAFLDRHLKRE